MRLRYFRNQMGLTQDELARKIGISKKSISAYETGRAVPPLRIALKIAKVLQVPVEELFQDQNTVPAQR